MSAPDECYFRAYSNINLGTVKISRKLDDTIANAIQKKDKISAQSVFKTQFNSHNIKAIYLSNDVGQSIFSVYKKHPYETAYQYVYTLETGATKVKDYNIKSNNFYEYMLATEMLETKIDEHGDPVVNEETGDYETQSVYYQSHMTDLQDQLLFFHTKFDGWTICDVVEDSENKNMLIKTGDIWNLGLNLQGEDVTQNLNITAWDTLGKYPRVSLGSTKYESMMFTGLLGSIETYTIYNYNSNVTDNLQAERYRTREISGYTEKQVSQNFSIAEMDENFLNKQWGVWREYATENDKLNAWRDFISNGETKLLRDIKGNAWLIQVVDMPTFSINTVSNLQQTTISFSWKEVDDVGKFSIINNRFEENE